MLRIAFVSLLLLSGCAGERVAAPRVAAAADDPAAAEAGAVRQALRDGYRKSAQNGTDSYCRDEALAGSHLTRHLCLTGAQLVELQRQAAASRPGPERGVSCASGNRQCAGPN